MRCTISPAAPREPRDRKLSAAVAKMSQASLLLIEPNVDFRQAGAHGDIFRVHFQGLLENADGLFEFSGTKEFFRYLQVLRAGVVEQSLLGEEFRQAEHGIDRRLELAQLLVHGDRLHRESLGGVGIANVLEVLERFVGLAQAGVEIAHGIHHREVLGVRLEDLLVFVDGVLQLTLLDRLLRSAESLLLVKPETKRHKKPTPSFVLKFLRSSSVYCGEPKTIQRTVRLSMPALAFRTRPIVRRSHQNRMVTKGYRKGVYERVTFETRRQVRGGGGRGSFPVSRTQRPVVARGQSGGQRRFARSLLYNMDMQSRVLKLDPRDNALVALTDLKQGEIIQFQENQYPLVTGVPAKEKFATEDLEVGQKVVMYGVVVGKAVRPIQRGERLTTANLQHEASEFHEQSEKVNWTPPDTSRWQNRTFQGYARADGQVGTRNYWIVVPLVFCENRNVEILKQAFEEELGFAAPQVYRHQVAELAKLYRQGGVEQVKSYVSSGNGSAPGAKPLFENIDGIRFLQHQGGCGGTRDDANTLCGLIAGYINHPNVAGGTILSLGCQNAQIQTLREQIRARNPKLAKPVIILDQQQSGLESAMLSRAIRETFLGLIEANKAQRTPAPLSKIVLGLKCGGSDGFSGISANPAIGHTSDLLVALGGTTILSEFPELCGSEQGLINRSVNKNVSGRFMQLMRDYQARAKAVGSGFENNPSPGNIRDGLITDAIKSAGAAKKGGTSPVTAVLDYPEYSKDPGLNLLCTPGNDVECVTAQVGAGANVVLFTTGLGTPTGNPIAPVVKLATNTDLAQRMADIIDIDTGGVIAGDSTIEQMGEAVLNLVIQVASGELHTKAELKGQEDFIPWKRGVSL